MSRLLLAIVLGLPFFFGSNRSETPAAPPSAAPASAHGVSAPQRVDFDTQIKPILQAHCMPCHFPEGIMHARLPFDRAETVRGLGEKLFTRLKDEKEQALLRSFFAQAP